MFYILNPYGYQHQLGRQQEQEGWQRRQQQLGCRQQQQGRQQRQ
jgi:hypothetical protein